MLKFDPGCGSLLLSYPCSNAHHWSCVSPLFSPAIFLLLSQILMLPIETFTPWTTSMPAIALSSEFLLNALTIHFIRWLPPSHPNISGFSQCEKLFSASKVLLIETLQVYDNYPILSPQCYIHPSFCSTISRSAASFFLFIRLRPSSSIILN